MEGVEVRVKVVNHLEREVLSVHWHGIHMLYNVWMDGVTYLTQCPMYILDKALVTRFQPIHLGLTFIIHMLTFNALMMVYLEF